MFENDTWVIFQRYESIFISNQVRKVRFFQPFLELRKVLIFTIFCRLFRFLSNFDFNLQFQTDLGKIRSNIFEFRPFFDSFQRRNEQIFSKFLQNLVTILHFWLFVVLLGITLVKITNIWSIFHIFPKKTLVVNGSCFISSNRSI